MPPSFWVASTKPEFARARSKAGLPCQGQGWALAPCDRGPEAGMYCWTGHQSAENLARLVHALDEPLDLLRHRVQVEAGPVGRGHAEPGHQGLAAVMARADRDSLRVEHLRHVVGVDALDVEGDDACAPLRRRAVQLHARDLCETLEC